jgi:hypothetical protein
MSLIIEQPELATADALSDQESALLAIPFDDDLEIIEDEIGVPHDPPSELLLTAASLVLWLGVAVVVRRVVARRHPPA